MLIDKKNNKKLIWPLLLEKAIAKEYGGYENLNGGIIDNALMMMAGKPAFRYNFLIDEIRLRLADDSFWGKILDFAHKGFLLSGGTLPKDRIPKEYEKITGSHAYAILDAFELDENRLLLLRDPTGSSNWVGEWSAGSEKWTSRLREMLSQRFINKDTKRHRGLPLIMSDIGKHLPAQDTFFMSWEEFIKCFEVMFVLIFFDDNWQCFQIFDNWENMSAENFNYINGGECSDPQYLLTVPEDMEFFFLLSHRVFDSFGTVPKIGFEIHKCAENFTGESEITLELIAVARYATEQRVSLDCVMKKGQYLILISTHDPNHSATFMFNMWYPKRCNNASKRKGSGKLCVRRIILE